jgi:DNA-directed RNA polymerase specialized sigma subunit
MKWRRYRTAEGVIVTTYEVPCTVLQTLGDSRLKSELQRAARQHERDARNARARTLLAAGWKPIAVGAEVGLSESQVRRLRQRAR